MKFVIYHSDYEYYKFLYDKTVTKHDVTNIYGFCLFTRSRVLKFLYRLHHSPITNRLFQLPFKSIWYGRMVPKSIVKKDEVCFVFNSSRASNIEYGFYDYLRSRYNCKLVLQLWNPIDWDKGKVGYNIDEMKRRMDLVCTYNRVDVLKYDVKLYPFILFKLENIIVKPLSERDIDVLFIGQDKGRMNYIETLYEKLTNKGLNCKFYIVNPQEGIHSKGIVKSNWIPYHRLIELTENSKCIVNILQPGAEGVTLRDIEAYNYGCFMITNNSSEDIKDIFNEGQLLEIKQIDDRIVNVIKERKEAFPKKPTLNTLDYFYSWLESSFELC